jgi:hypothetical protein
MRLLQRQLGANFRSIIRKHLNDKATTDIVEELTTELVAAVPIVRINPRDEGLFFYHGAVDESDVVTAQYEILSAHMNLSPERNIEITLSTASISVFAATAFIAIISSLQAQRRRVRVHSIGWVSAAVLAVVQSADERTIESSAFVLTCPDSPNRITDGDGVSPEAVAYEIFLKQYIRRGESVPPFWERYPTSGVYLPAVEAVEQGLFDRVAATMPGREP